MITVNQSFIHYSKRMAEYIRLQIEIGNIKTGSPIDSAYLGFMKEIELIQPTVTKNGLQLSHIKNIVCDHYKIDEEILAMNSQKRIHVEPRMVYVYLCRKHTDKTLEKIGETINRNYTTVLYLQEKIESRLSFDHFLQRDIHVLNEQIKELKNVP